MAYFNVNMLFSLYVYYWAGCVLFCPVSRATFPETSHKTPAPKTGAKNNHNENNNHEKLNSEAAAQEIPDFQFLRAKQASSPLQPIRPYTLSITHEDYNYQPKPKHLKPARLLRVLGASFDPFWMSVEKPFASEPHETNGSFSNSSPELVEGAARYQRKLEKEAQEVDLDWFGSAEKDRFRAWLVQMASCRLTHRWVDLGPVFWPRWIRHTDCEEDSAGPSCSFPAGMTCKRAQVTQIKILAWHCWFGLGGVGGLGEGAEAKQQHCVWRQVPYPVVTACKCMCR
ncbi:noggin-2-like [Acipenser ruthenus]|uniref:noggin-2-like n=1 Tax=Acipenser ruthenus TaxID=7906 RepID=UPI002741DC0F|nr:noggin-2-like [Acipenser ruthenus]